MKPFCAVIFEDKAGNIFFPRSWVAYDEETLEGYIRDYKPDFPFMFRVGIQWFKTPPEFTPCLARSNRELYMISGPMLEEAKRRNPSLVKVH